MNSHAPMLSRQRDVQTRENVIALRAALFDESGRDKDVTSGLTPMLRTFTRDGINVTIEFTPKLTEEQLEWAFELTKDRMEAIYDDSGYGWDDDDKRDELAEQGARFLLVYDKTESSETYDQLVGFVHFRFTVQGEVMEMMRGDTCIYIWEIQLEDDFQHKGLGRHLLMMLEIIGVREKMKSISFPVQSADEDTKSWISKMRGYAPDTSLEEVCGFDSKEEGFIIYSKSLVKQGPSSSVLASPVSSSEKATVSSPSTVASIETLTTAFQKAAVDEATIEENQREF